MFRKFLKEYLSLTTGERRGFTVLVILAMASILIRAMLPSISRPLPGTLSSLLDRPDTMYAGFQFDPNSLCLDSLISLGIPRQTARILVNYRQGGGSFRRKEDLLKVYGMDTSLFERLEPWIEIPASTSAGPDARPGVTDTGTVFPYGYDEKKFEINSADTAQLKTVYGIGPVFARRIAKYRHLLGGFYHMDQLKQVYGLSEQQFSAISMRCWADTSMLRTIDLNRASLDDLQRHPYLDGYQASALIDYRETTGAFQSLEEVRRNHLLPPEVYRKVAPYFRISE